jgi:beta-lactamase regulating signal transducer with metallopeptidase domain
MRSALPVSGYALMVAWCGPALLSRLTAPGCSARLGLAAWLTAMVSTLVSVAVALQFLVTAAIAGWSHLAEVVCRSVAGHACARTVYQNAVFELALGAIAIVAALAAGAAAWRYGRSVQRAQRQAREHAEVARVTGRGLPGDNAAVVLEAPQPVAYCVSGRPATIVVTSGALALLDPAQLAAVLAHERAHLAGRHHLLIALSRGLAAVFPAVPLFARGAQNVARLAEMCADDVAARGGGRRPLIAALLVMAAGASVPTSALGAMACAVTARLQRLLEVPRRARQAGYGLALTAVILLLALVPGLLTAFAVPLAAHGLAG